MPLLLDLIILIIFAVNIYGGWKNGLIRTVLHTCSTLISLILSYLFTPPFAEYLRTAFFDDTIKNQVSSALNALMKAGNETIDIHKLFEDAPAAFRELLSGFGIELDVLEEQFANAIATGSNTLQQDVVEYIATPITNMISTALAFLILFAVCVLGLHIASFCLDTIARLPVLRQINKTLGIALGVLTGFLMAWGVSAVFAELMPALAKLYPEVISETLIEDTILVKILAGLGLIPSL